MRYPGQDLGVDAAPAGQPSLVSADISVEYELARCDSEIAWMEKQQSAPAWLVTLGIEDWKCEKRLILATAGQPERHQRKEK